MTTTITGRTGSTGGAHTAARLTTAALAMITIIALAGCGAISGAASRSAPSEPSAPPTSAGPNAPGPAADPGDGSAAPQGSSADAGDASCPSDIVARICTDVSLSGAATIAGRGIVTAPIPPGSDPSTTCSAIAANQDGGNLGDHLDTIDGHQLAWDTTLTDYLGPGSYSGSEFHLTIDDDAYSASSGGKVAIVIGSDFATTITMTDLLSSGDSPTRVSGTIAWTCVDPSNGG